MADVWSYHPGTEVPHESIVGFEVEATDGSIGTVDEAQHDPDDAFLIVDTGHWIFGKKRVIPARAIVRIDVEARRIYLRVSKDHVEAGPDHRVGWNEDEETRSLVASHFAEFQ